MKKTPGERTLLMSVLLSAPGPLVVGFGLLVGKSSTQLADFIRRTAELAALIVSWLVFRVLHRGEGEAPRQKDTLERYATLGVGLSTCLSGAAMVLVAILSNSGDKGNVIPGLVIGVLGVITNTWFWYRYTRLNRETPNAILAVQSRLYRAKSLVDLCVTAALMSILLFPGSPVADRMDTVGSLVVALYLIINGVNILMNKEKRSGVVPPDGRRQ